MCCHEPPNVQLLTNRSLDGAEAAGYDIPDIPGALWLETTKSVDGGAVAPTSTARRGAVQTKRRYPTSLRPARWRGAGRLGDIEHAVEGDLGPFRGVVVDGNAVNGFTGNQFFERPGQMGCIDTEHGRTRTHQRVE